MREKVRLTRDEQNLGEGARRGLPRHQVRNWQNCGHGCLAAVYARGKGAAYAA